MSKYAHLSKPDPEFAALLKKINLPRPTPPLDIAAAQQEWMERSVASYVAHEKARLPPGW